MSVTVAERARARQDARAIGASPVPALPPEGTANLAAEYPDGPVPEPTHDAASAAMLRGETHYVEVAGIATMRAAVTRFLAFYGYETDASNVLVTAGEQEARFLSLQALTAAFGPVAIPAVVHPGVLRARTVRRFETRTMPVDGDLQPTAAGVRAALDAGARIVYLEMPNRLTGAMLSAAFWEEVTALLVERDAYAIVDIGVLPFIERQGNRDITLPAGLADRALVLGTPYPGGGADAWLVGYLAGPKALTARVAPLKQVTSICTCAPAQWGVAGGAEVWREDHTATLATLWKESDHAAEYAGAALLHGASATVLALRVADGAAVTARLGEHGFAVADGTAFGAPDVVRVSVRGDGTAVEAVRIAMEGEAR